jgi:glycosyltransferase involved in cell wall biosynthesis
MTYNLEFSVLTSVYRDEKPDWFSASLKSLSNQTVSPSEIILVKDGPLTGELDNIISEFQKELSNHLIVIQLDHNSGLGKALNVGLEYCSHELIARMDSDDICCEDRFEKQLLYYRKHTEVDVLGGYISEFYEDKDDEITAIRRVPLTHYEIKKRVRFRSPMNHVTVMYKKSVVEAVGGYRIPWPGRDHDLWLKLIINGSNFANLPEILVKVRTGGDQLTRRGGWKFIQGEILLHYDFYRKGFINRFELIRNLGVRLGIRLLPKPMLRQFYKANRKYFS